MDLDGAFGYAAVIHLHEDLPQAAIAPSLKDHLSLMGQRKTDLWIRERKLLHDIADQGKFILRRFQVLKAGRCALKEMFDFDPSAGRTGSWMCAFEFAIADLYFRPLMTIIGLQDNMGNRCDRGESLSAESHGVDVPEIILFFHLAGRMPLERCGRILCIHAFSIICDDDAFDPALDDVDSNVMRMCIDAVFHQLFDDAAWSFHDLSGRDHIAQMFAQHIDLSHAYPLLCHIARL